MNATQIAAALKTAETRKQQVAALKVLRDAGVEVLVKLNATTRAIADEVARLLKAVTTAVKTAFKTVSTEVKAKLAFLSSRPVKALNSRAVSGAIALSLKLGI